MTVELDHQRTYRYTGSRFTVHRDMSPEVAKVAVEDVDGAVRERFQQEVEQPAVGPDQSLDGPILTGHTTPARL